MLFPENGNLATRSPLAFTPMDGGLIFDLGMNDGSDTAFYLAKGFSVVGVDAAEDLAARARQYQAEIDSGRLSSRTWRLLRVKDRSRFTRTRKAFGERPDRTGPSATASCHTSPLTPSPSTACRSPPARQVRHPVLPEDRHRGADLAALSGLTGKARYRHLFRSSRRRCPGTLCAGIRCAERAGIHPLQDRAAALCQYPPPAEAGPGGQIRSLAFSPGRQRPFRGRSAGPLADP